MSAKTIDSGSIRILRLPEVVRKTGLCKSTIYQRLRQQAFPCPVALGPNSVGFVEAEVNDWLSSLIMLREHQPRKVA
ncbi:helix-turn-helix transcriptional regulator [Rhodoferax bucti]|uniref:helix-turn-helix transcriptional regulator n=1 Tax=Rhodoferax bucti TaxID=2576305 RepID=UPI0014774C9C|nr:AlpA family phage regulatory protein [Rhodoferax bucti]